MLKQVFPTGLVVAENFMSFEAMKLFEKDWDVSSSQMKKGDFKSELYAVHTPNIQIGTRSYNKGMMFRGYYPEHCVVIYLYVSKSLVRVENKIIGRNELLIGLPSGKLDIIIDSAFTVYTVAIEKVFFNKAFKTLFSQSFDTYSMDKMLLVNPLEMTKFLEDVSTRIASLSNHEFNEQYDYDALELELLDSLFGCIEQSEKIPFRKKFDIVKVRKYLDDNIHFNITISEMSKALNIGKRQLQNAFKINYGMTPKKYMQMIRLNAVYKELRQVEVDEVTVTEVAYKYDFIHLSYFTKQYKQLFSETPSCTLNKRVS